MLWKGGGKRCFFYQEGGDDEKGETKVAISGIPGASFPAAKHLQIRNSQEHPTYQSVEPCFHEQDFHANQLPNPILHKIKRLVHLEEELLTRLIMTNWM